jgi:hypothetical protein
MADRAAKISVSLETANRGQELTQEFLLEENRQAT